jgi:hypothetical protein
MRRNVSFTLETQVAELMLNGFNIEDFLVQIFDLRPLEGACRFR